MTSNERPITPSSGPLPPPAIPIPVGPSPLELLLRTGIHALIILIVANALAALLATRPLGQHIVTVIRPFFFVPWSVGVGAGLNADKLAVTLLALVITIACWPDNLLGPGTAAVTGFITGLSARHLLLGGLYGRQ